jgi:hypothetical protein
MSVTLVLAEVLRKQQVCVCVCVCVCVWRIQSL